jgi:hypothetical protein
VLLNQIFEQESSKVMLLKRVSYGRGTHPLQDIRYIYETLLLVSKDRESVEKKMRLIKIHISNLPQSHIKT